MSDFDDRELHLMKKALAIAVLAIERQEGALQSASDMSDMKSLLGRLISSEAVFEHYIQAARIVVQGRPD